MDSLLPVGRGGPVLVPCNKCGGQFTLEKQHKEIYIGTMFYGRKKDGTLTPANPKDVKVYRLCFSCAEKLKDWFETK